MYFIIFMIAPVAILLLVLVTAYMLLTVGFEGPTQPPTDAARAYWRPPLVRGKRLTSWGTKMSQALSQQLLASPRCSATATDVALGMHAAANFAIGNLPRIPAVEDVGSCRYAAFRRVRVTAPEVLAIADKIRTKVDESKRVHDLASENAKRLALGESAGFGNQPMTCPLRNVDGACAAQDLCPLDCRVGCRFDESTADGQGMSTLARDLEEGIVAGLSRGLKAKGLTGHVYELNSALAVALETPEASNRWAHGEDVLAGCARD